MRDLLYAVRGLLATPLVSLVAVLSLALGIGANTAIGIRLALGATGSRIMAMVIGRVAVLVGTGALAGAIPARKAAAIDPMVVLRR